MTSVQFARVTLIIAGSATTGLAAFHFLVPYVFAWARFVDPLPPELRWTLFSMNAFLSLLLLIGGLASLRIAQRGQTPLSWPVWMMALFWIVNAAYQLWRPFPTPGVRWVLLGFALAVAILYAVVLFIGARNRPKGVGAA